MKKEKKNLSASIFSFIFSFVIFIITLFYIYLGFIKIFDLFSLFLYIFLLFSCFFILKLIENIFIEKSFIIIKLYLKINNILFNIIGILLFFLLFYIIVSYTSYNNFISLKINYIFKVDYILFHLFITIFYLIFLFLISNISKKKKNNSNE